MFEPVKEDLLNVTELEVLGKLPDPFLKADGTRVKSPEEWEGQRRALYKTAVELQYGVQPPRPNF